MTFPLLRIIQLVFFLICLCLLFSCSKEIKELPVTPELSQQVSFSVDGVPYGYSASTSSTICGIQGVKQTVGGNQWYSVNVFINQGLVFYLVVQSDTLIAGRTYPAQSSTKIQANNTWNVFKQQGDTIAVKVLSYSNQILTANFSGRLSSWTLQPAFVTNGVIRSVKILF